MPAGITAETVGDFLDGLDIVIEVCDSLDAKVLVREVARTRRLPVLMAPSDRGLLDVERFDIEPSHPTMHGLLGDVDSARLANLTNEERLPHALRMTDATRVAPRMAASLIEVSKTLSTWPQLSSEVADIGRREAGASDPVAIAGVLAWGGVGRRHQLFAHTSDYDYLVQNG